MNAQEAKKAPKSTKFTAKMIGKGCEDYKFTMAVSPLDCMGCGLCVNVCPVAIKAKANGTPEKTAIRMVPQASQADQQAAFDYAVANVSKKELPFAETSVKPAKVSS